MHCVLEQMQNSLPLGKERERVKKKAYKPNIWYQGKKYTAEFKGKAEQEL